jgi:hypothetical protein
VLEEISLEASKQHTKNLITPKIEEWKTKKREKLIILFGKKIKTERKFSPFYCFTRTAKLHSKVLSWKANRE